MKIDPITSPKPTNVDLARGFNQIHECLEDHKEQTAQGLAALTSDVGTIRDAMKLGEGQKPVAGLSTPRQAFWRTFLAVTASISAISLTVRIGMAIWPGLEQIAKAVWAAFLAGKL